MQVRTHKVTHVRQLGGDGFVLRVEGPFPVVEGGQFCMLSTPRDWPVLLPRPFSYFDVEPGENGFASFLGKAIGPGSRALRDLEPGDEVIVTGPLGTGFPAVEDSGPEPVCIAGGVGLAPFLLWAKARRVSGHAPIPLLYGGATKEAIVGTEDFAARAQTFHLATEDGSLGHRGNVLELYRSLVQAAVIDGEAPVYCCGPDPMMRAIAVDCGARGVPCFVSLETYMACGYGVCNGCSVQVQAQGRFEGKVYARTCIAGPVFEADELVW